MGERLVYYSIFDPTGQMKWVENVIYHTKEEAISAAQTFLKRIDPIQFVHAGRPEPVCLRPNHGGRLYLESRLLSGSPSVVVNKESVTLTATFEWRVVETWSELCKVETGGQTYERLQLREEEAIPWQINISPTRNFILYVQRSEWVWAS